MSTTANREVPWPVAASPTSCDVTSRWASLHEDLVLLVGRRVLAGDLLDYVRFWAVCTYWRSTTICPRGRGITDPRFHPRRWMMLPEGHGLHPKEDDKKRFFNLSTGAFVRPRLPILRYHRVICTVEGLLLLGQQQRDQKGEITICLLHAFTGDIVHLPPLSPRMGYWRWQLDSLLCDSITVCLSVGVDGVATVMLLLLFLPGVIFATTKDKQWSFSSWCFSDVTIRSPISFQGKLYMLQCASMSPREHHILQIGPPRYEDGSTTSGFGSLSLPLPKVIARCPSGLRGPFDLAECGSEILVTGFSKGMRPTHVLAYRIADLILGRVLPATNIGGSTLFLDIGRNISSLPDQGRSLTASHKVIPTIEGDTIIRLHPRKNYIVQYHLSSGTWSQTTGECLKGRRGSLCLCGLIYHIYGHCCCAKPGRFSLGGGWGADDFFGPF